MPRCLMLDVDGVLVHGRPDGRSWAADIERDLGIAPARLAAEFFAPHWPDIVTGQKDLHEILKACLPTLAPGLTPDAFLAYWFENDGTLDHALLAECDALRDAGVRIILATNQEHLRARDLMERLGLARHVDGIAYSAALAVRKPDPAFFAAAMAATRTKPADILFVDDTPANVEAARGAGWQAILWQRGSTLMPHFKSPI